MVRVGPIGVDVDIEIGIFGDGEISEQRAGDEEDSFADSGAARVGIGAGDGESSAAGFGETVGTGDGDADRLVAGASVDVAGAAVKCEGIGPRQRIVGDAESERAHGDVRAEGHGAGGAGKRGGIVVAIISSGVGAAGLGRTPTRVRGIPDAGSSDGITAGGSPENLSRKQGGREKGVQQQAGTSEEAGSCHRIECWADNPAAPVGALLCQISCDRMTGTTGSLCARLSRR